MFPEQRPAETRAEALQAAQQPEPATSTRARIDYLDGIRGLAALAVAVLHAFQMFGYGLGPVGIESDGLLTGHGLERLIPPLFNNVIQFGAYAVEVFIVISGYSLMLGVARSADGQLKGGLRAYFKRRVRRIWPPYYAALVLCVLIIVVIPGMNTPSNMYWDLALPVDSGAVISHALFLHYLTPEWFYRINPPMWTVALEEHIYIIFPFVLLPLWRRLGVVRMMLLGLVGSVGLWFLLRPWFEGANFWFVGLFALGAAAATVGFSARESDARWRHRLPWGVIGVILLAVFFVIVQYSLRVNSGLFSLPWIKDVILGAGVACLLIHLTERWKANPERSPSRVVRFLAHPLVVSLGLFSYSLYLMHAPLLALVARVIRDAGFTSIPAYVLILLVGLPVALFGSYIFHRVFERPFMPVHANWTREAPGGRPAIHIRILASIRQIVGI